MNRKLIFALMFSLAVLLIGFTGVIPQTTVEPATEPNRDALVKSIAILSSIPTAELPILPTWDKALKQIADSCREMPELSLNNEKGYVINPYGGIEYLYYLLDKAGLEKDSRYYWELGITYVPNTSYCWVGLVSYTENDLTMVFENSDGKVDLLPASPPPSRYESVQSRSVP